jgi:hypothetical protein
MRWRETGEYYIMRSFITFQQIFLGCQMKHVARVVEMRNAYKIMVRKFEGKDLDVDGILMLDWNLG